MTFIAPLIAIGSLLLGSLMATLYVALGVVARQAVESIASARNDHAALRRIEVIFDDAAGHARAVGLVRILCDLGLLVSMVYWTAQVRSGTAGEGLNPARHDVLSVTLAVLASGVLLFIFGVIVPMAIANHTGSRLIYSRSLLLRVTERVCYPLTLISGFFDEVVRRLAGNEVRPLEEQVQQDLLSAVEEGEREGALDEHDRAMIEAVMQFGSRTVAQVMTPRTAMEALEYTNNLGEVTKSIRTIGHSRIPVYEESLDHIVGMFYVKDLMRWLAGDVGARGSAGGKAFELRAILRPALFVPESKTVRELLREMIDKKVHIALVADEYGGTSGLVTIEDIFEEIVGDIKDEYEVGPAEVPDVVLKLEHKKADVDAAARISDVNDALLPLGIEIPESEEYDTVGGFIITTLGRIPVRGEKFQHKSMEFTILEAKPTKVVKVAVEVKEPTGLTEAESLAEDDARRK
ncbi:MAG: hemolysin family protein [Phycisphaerales bacterium]